MNYNENSVIVDSMTVGEAWPIYTWRKGGASTFDDHLYLQIGSAHDPFNMDNVLLEIDPVTKVTIFHNEARLLNGLSFDSNTLNGSSLKDGTVDGSKITPGTAIDGSITRLTTGRLIDGVRFDGSANAMHFCICPTVPDDKIKTVSCAHFNKVSGAIVYIKFEHTNTHTSPLLNVNDTGAATMLYEGVPLDHLSIKQGVVYGFVYDGENYNLLGTLDNSVKQINSSSDSAQYNILLSADANKIGDYSNTSRYVDGVTIEPSTKTLSINRLVSPLYAAGWLEANTKDSIITSTASSGEIVSFLRYNGNDGVFTLSGASNGLSATFTERRKVTVSEQGYTYKVELIDQNGNATFPNQITAAKVKADTFDGANFTGTAAVATRAINDSNGDNIVSTYIKKVDAETAFVNVAGDTMKGKLNLVPIENEKNVIASTVGYVDKKVRTEVDALEEKILNGVSEEYDTLKELLGGIEQNKDVIDQLSTIVKSFVSFKEEQSLSEKHQNIARTNIHAFSASGGTLANNGSIVGNEATFNNFNVVTGTSSTIDFVDSSNAVLGAVVQTNTASGKSTGLSVGDKSIKLVTDYYGNVTNYVDHPTSDSSNEIATTQYVSDRLYNALYIDNKQYTKVTTKSDAEHDNVLYYANITPIDNDTPWYVKVRVVATVPSYSAFAANYVSELSGVGQTYAYKHFVHFANESRRSFDGLVLRTAPKTALASNNPHLLGLSLYQTQSATTVEYSRTLVVEVLDSSNCIVTLLDNIVADSSISAATYSNEYSIVHTRYSGVFHANDDKLNDCLIQSGTFIKTADEPVQPHTLVMEDAEGLYHSLPTSASTGNLKHSTKVWLNPSKVYYHGGEKVIPARSFGTEPDVKYFVSPFDIRYSFNVFDAPNVGDKIYIKCTYDKGTGLVQLADNWLSHYLPGNNDDHVYILVGVVTGDVGGSPSHTGHLAYVNTMYAWGGVKYEAVGGGGSAGGMIGMSIHPFLQNSDTERGDAQPNSIASIRLNVHDKTSATYGSKESVLAYLEQSVDTTTIAGDTINTFALVANDPTTRTTEDTAELGVGYHVTKDGVKKPFAYAITPDLDDISSSIATTGWTEQRLQLLAATIGDAFEEVTDTLLSGYASVDSLQELVAKYNELTFKFEQLESKYQVLLDQHNTFLVDVSNTYCSRVDVANNYLSKTEATNLYLTKTEAADTYITTQFANTYLISREEYQSEIEKAYSRLM